MGGPPAPRGPQINIIAALVKRKKLAVLVFFAVALPGMAISWSKGRPFFVSQASIYVAARFMSTLESDAEIQGQALNYRNFLSQQALNIQRFEIIEEALRRMGDDRYLWQYPDESDLSAINRLRFALEIVPDHSAYTIDVALLGSQPTGLADIVNAVVDVYLASQRGEAFYAEEDRLENLGELRAEIASEIEYFVGKKSELAEVLGVSDFSTEASNPYQSSLLETSSALSTARRDLMSAQSELDALMESQAAIEGLELESEARLTLPEGATAGTTGDPLMTRLATLITDAATLTPEHPGYRATWDEIAAIENAMTEAHELAIQERVEVLAARRATQHVEDLAVARAAVEKAQDYVVKLEEESERLRQKASEFVIAFEDGREYERSLERLKARKELIDDRREFFEVESESPGFVRLISKARTPEVPIRDRRLKFMAAFLVLAAGLGVGSTIVAEALDRRIRSPLDLERALGIPPLAWLTERTNDSTTRLAEDQLRRMALSLSREHRAAGVRRCVLTGIATGSGVTTLIDLLGVELLSVGLKVLTIDGNALGTVEVEGRAGLIDLLESGVDPQAAIVKGTPDHLPLGASTGLRRLPAVNKLNQLFDLLDQEYDMILLDAPPLLLSSDAELLVSSCDATLLVIGAEHDDVGEVKKTLAVLERLAPPNVGLVLNRVRVRGKLDEVQGAIREPPNWT